MNPTLTLHDAYYAKDPNLMAQALAQGANPYELINGVSLAHIVLADQQNVWMQSNEMKAITASIFDQPPKNAEDFEAFLDVRQNLYRELGYSSSASQMQFIPNRFEHQERLGVLMEFKEIMEGSAGHRVLSSTPSFRHDEAVSLFNKGKIDAELDVARSALPQFKPSFAVGKHNDHENDVARKVVSETKDNTFDQQYSLDSRTENKVGMDVSVDPSDDLWEDVPRMNTARIKAFRSKKSLSSSPETPSTKPLFDKTQ